jgi:hypothetical protein
VQLKDKWRNLIKFQHLRRGEAESAPQGDRGGARGGGTAMKKWRIVVLRFGTARQDMVLEWWTNLKPFGVMVDRAAI